MKRFLVPSVMVVLSACSQQKSKSPDLPDQPDRWVTSVALQSDSKVLHVGKTSIILQATSVKPINGLQSVTIGDNIDGVYIGAIKCAFFNNDGSHSGEQFMWRGRWGCMAGRNQDELNTSVQDDGSKLFEYIYAAPITLTP